MTRGLWYPLWRANRLELLLLLLATVGVVIAAVLFTVALRAQAPPPECLLGNAAAPEWCDAANASFRPFFETRQASETVMLAFWILPLVIGAVLGAPLVARELERGTAPLAWSLATSRRRWLLERLVVVGLVTVVLLGLLGLAGHLLAGARDPETSPMASLTDLGARGPSVLVRGLIVFSVGVLMGALGGRVLPALLLASVAAVAIVALGGPAALLGLPDETIGGNGSALVRHSVSFDRAWLTPDGVVLDEETALAAVPSDATDAYRWLDEHYSSVSIGIPGTRYPVVEARIGLFGLLTCAIVLGGTFLVVDRRRPA
jgi:hypothetical protein